MEKILQSIADNPRGAFVANLAASIVVLMWTWGIDPEKRDPWIWRGWVGFWGATCMFYLVRSVFPSWESAGSFGWLYVATFALLLPLGSHGKPSRRYALMLGSVCVTVVLADILTVQEWGVSGWHQGLTGVALMLWAWKIRSRDVSKSVILIGYAIVQMPIQPLLEVLGVPTVDYAIFVRATYLAYIVLKIPLIPTIYLAAQRSAGGPS